MRARGIVIALLVIALLAAILIFLLSTADVGQTNTVGNPAGTADGGQTNTIGNPASDFTLQTHDGKKLTLSSLKGKRGVVLVFFSTWCPPCIAEVPEVKEFAEAGRDRNVLVYGVNIQQSQRIVERFVKDYKVNYRILLDTDAEVARAYRITGIPSIIGIDTRGIVQYREHGLPRDANALIEKLTAPADK